MQQLKGDEFNDNALSNTVAQCFAHSTSKTVTKMKKKNLVTVLNRASPLNSFGFKAVFFLSKMIVVIIVLYLYRCL